MPQLEELGMEASADFAGGAQPGSAHPPSAADLSALLAAKDAELSELRQQLAQTTDDMRRNLAVRQAT